MSESTTPLGAVIYVLCSDDRRTAPHAEWAAEKAAQGIRVFVIREPGGALLYSDIPWVLSALRLLVFLKGGARTIVLENHRDCKGLQYRRNSLREKLLLRLRGLRNEDEHHLWLLERSARRLALLAAIRRIRELRIHFLLVDPHDRLTGAGPAPDAASMPVRPPSREEAPRWARPLIPATNN